MDDDDIPSSPTDLVGPKIKEKRLDEREKLNDQHDCVTLFHMSHLMCYYFNSECWQWKSGERKHFNEKTVLRYAAGGLWYANFDQANWMPMGIRPLTDGDVVRTTADPILLDESMMRFAVHYNDRRLNFHEFLWNLNSIFKHQTIFMESFFLLTPCGNKSS